MLAQEDAMPAQKLKQYLDDNKVKYLALQHSPAYTAQEVAASAHIPGKDVAKVVMVKLDGTMTMAVLPASLSIDFERLGALTSSVKVELAEESEFAGLFPGCEPGAMSPFGNLYGIEVVVATPLAEDEEIAFNAGTHFELIKMAYADFERLVQPKILPFHRS
jgi:Ala-tRNA(Pro) deacylase